MYRTKFDAAEQIPSAAEQHPSAAGVLFGGVGVFVRRRRFCPIHPPKINAAFVNHPTQKSTIREVITWIMTSRRVVFLGGGRRFSGEDDRGGGLRGDLQIYLDGMVCRCAGKATRTLAGASPAVPYLPTASTWPFLGNHVKRGSPKPFGHKMVALSSPYGA